MFKTLDDHIEMHCSIKKRQYMVKDMVKLTLNLNLSLYNTLICFRKIVGKLRCRKNEMSEKCDKKCFTFPTEIVSEK